MAERYIAHFRPEAWQGDNAIEVDAVGPQEWDCTDYFIGEVLPMFLKPPFPRDVIKSEGEWQDDQDWLLMDPNIPTWCSKWKGPFTITVRERRPEDADIPEVTPQSTPDPNALRSAIEDACADFHINDHAQGLIDELVATLTGGL